MNNDKAYVDYYPIWIKEIDDTFINDNFLKIFYFYVIKCPFVSGLSFQKCSLSSFGWKDNSWNKYYYLKYYLDKDVFYSRQHFFRAKKDYNIFAQCTKEIGYDTDFYKDLSNERVLIYDCERNKYKSLFIHIRCALAHGRFNIIHIKESNENIYIMENCNPKDKNKDNEKIKLTARMILKENTLLRWIEIIKNGPEIDNIYSDIFNYIKNKSGYVSISEISNQYRLSKSVVSSYIKKLKRDGKIIKFDKKIQCWQINYNE